MYRFFLEIDPVPGDRIEIRGNDYRHISRSLRLKVGDRIIICNGKGWDYLVLLDIFSEVSVQAIVEKKIINSNEAGVRIALAQGIPKNNNMDYIVQKSTEIGVYKIIPLKSSRTIVELDEKKEKKRLDRWQRIAEEAAKQSNRGIIPEVEIIYDIKNLSKIFSNYDIVLVPWEEEKQNNFKSIIKNFFLKEIRNILLIIGPEGGFSSSEINFIKSAGGIPITLGPRILRTETAGIVSISIMLYEFGYLGG
jgi:16S rRNA (uracil1498-N3)-methyltransferase